MSMFTALRGLLRPSPPRTSAEGFRLPFGFNQEEWNALKSLQSHPAWNLYLKALDAIARLDGERMLISSDTNVLHFLRGHVGGLRKAGIFIDEIAQDERRHAAEKDKQAKAHARPSDTSALFGSPGWRPQRKPDASGV